MRVKNLLKSFILSLCFSGIVSSPVFAFDADQDAVNKAIQGGKSCATDLTGVDKSNISDKCRSCCTDTSRKYLFNDRLTYIPCINSCADQLKQKFLDIEINNCAASIPNADSETVSASCETCCRGTGVLGTEFWEKCKPGCLNVVSKKQKSEIKSDASKPPETQSEAKQLEANKTQYVDCHYSGKYIGDSTFNKLTQAECDEQIARLKAADKPAANQAHEVMKASETQVISTETKLRSAKKQSNNV